MDRKIKAWMLVLSVAVICGGALGAVIWYRARHITTLQMYHRLDSTESIILYLDVQALRESGILERLLPKTVEEPEYRKFVQKVGFDYRSDLDHLMVAFGGAGKFLLARGQFDWRKLRDYVREQGGSCYALVCRTAGSAPDRQIAFLPLQANVMAMSVAPREGAVYRLTGQPSGPEVELPKDPIWLSIPQAVLRSGQGLPSSARMFARSIAQADRVLLAVNLESGRLAARMEVQCVTEGEAAEVVRQLTEATNQLRNLIGREFEKPNLAGLGGVLASGEFRAEGVRAIGHWWVPDEFVGSEGKRIVN